VQGRDKKDSILDSNFTGLNSSRQSSIDLERINDVATHMFSQYTEFRNAGANAGEILENIYENMKSVSDYLKQTFAARGVSVENIRCERDSETQSIVLSVLWQKIGFTLVSNTKPLYIQQRGGTKAICYRIIATKSNCSKTIKENPDNYLDKLLDDEVASLYVPADKSNACEMRTRYLANNIYSLSHQQAPKEFFMSVFQYICSGGSKHIEREFSSKISSILNS
jgi:hypothetical protein